MFPVLGEHRPRGRNFVFRFATGEGPGPRSSLAPSRHQVGCERGALPPIATGPTLVPGVHARTLALWLAGPLEPLRS